MAVMVVYDGRLLAAGTSVLSDWADGAVVHGGDSRLYWKTACSRHVSLVRWADGAVVHG